MLVIGLGNEFRHDDAVGLIAARQLRERGVSTEEHERDLASLTERWGHADGVILIDAVRSGVPPGTVHHLNVGASPLNRGLFRSSTHALGLADAVELSRTLGTLPACVHIFGVEVRDLSVGTGLSADVQRALPSLIEEVLTCMKHHAEWSSSCS
jgi:hydrogenase maturation protease